MANLHSLREADLFFGLSGEQLTRVAEVAREMGFRKNEYLFRIGNETDTLMVISKGSIQLTMPLVVLGADTEVALEDLSEGSTLGWSALVPPHVLTMSAKATSDADVVGFYRHDLQRLFDLAPDLGYRIIANLAAVVGRRLHLTQTMWARELQRYVADKYR
jgi:CRP/FNR family cyclic AMP-dependent transcriptional regulator